MFTRVGRRGVNYVRVIKHCYTVSMMVYVRVFIWLSAKLLWGWGKAVWRYLFGLGGGFRGLFMSRCGT